jgi:hypothetical protein
MELITGEAEVVAVGLVQFIYSLMLIKLRGLTCKGAYKSAFLGRFIGPQGFPKPCVGGSNPSRRAILLPAKRRFRFGTSVNY